jgi:preprotein translocase subunit SecA
MGLLSKISEKMDERELRKFNKVAETVLALDEDYGKLSDAR